MRAPACVCCCWAKVLHFYKLLLMLVSVRYVCVGMSMVLCTLRLHCPLCRYLFKCFIHKETMFLHFQCSFHVLTAGLSAYSSRKSDARVCACVRARVLPIGPQQLQSLNNRSPSWQLMYCADLKCCKVVKKTQNHNTVLCWSKCTVM